MKLLSMFTKNKKSLETYFLPFCCCSLARIKEVLRREHIRFVTIYMIQFVFLGIFRNFDVFPDLRLRI